MNVLKSALALILGFSVSSTVLANELIKVAQDNAKSTLTEKATMAKDAVSDKVKSAKEAAAEKATAAKESMTDKVKSAKEGVVEKAKSAKETATEKAKTAKDAVSEKASAAKEAVADKAKAAKETAADKVKAAKETVATKAATSAKVNVNTADVATLQQLSGIGDVKAKAIIDYRNKVGKFKSAEDLINVSGIGEATIEKIKPFLSF